jgi:hypothetical protein
VDSETSISFPARLKIGDNPELTLLGLGVRRVTFLKVAIYSIGFYADLNKVNLKELPDGASFEDKIEHIIHNTTCALVLMPTRSTSLTHLRDAFLRALTLRFAYLREKALVTPEDEEDVQAPTQELKNLFPSTNIEKETPLQIILSPPAPGVPRKITITRPAGELGEVKHTRLSLELFKSYFGEKCISIAMKSSVESFVNGL